MDADGIGRLLGRLYTAFILRDLTFFVSGGVVLAAIIQEPIDEGSSALSAQNDFSWIGIPIFLALSYVVGLLLQEIVRIPLEPLSNRWIRVRRGRSVTGERLVVRMERVYRTNMPNTALGVERILFLKQVAATQFSAMGALAILTATNATTLFDVPPWAFIAISVVWAYVYFDKTLQEDDILIELVPPAS